MSDLRALAERLEKATGADRALDGLLAVLGGWEWHGDGGVERHATCAGHWVSPESPTNGSFGKRGPGLCDCLTISERFGNTEDAPAYTSSIDAAVALAERVLAGCHWSVTNAAVRPRANVWAPQPTRPIMGPYSSAPTPALALCLAVVRAKLAEAE